MNTLGGIRSDGSWRNWAGNQCSSPVHIGRPRGEDEVVALVRSAASDGMRVRAVGSSHSFNGIANTDEVLVTTEGLATAHEVDASRGIARVGAGMRLKELNPLLEGEGLALPNLGDIDSQTVAGAIATSTHGTGLKFRGIADSVVGLRMVVGDGTIVTLDQGTEQDLFEVARVGLGSLGIITEVTLACVPAFNLHAVEEVLPISEIVACFDEWAETTDHVEFFWMPHTEFGLVKRNSRVAYDPSPPRNRRHAARRRWKRFKNAEIVENLLFGGLNYLGRLRPSLVPRLNALVLSEGARAEYVASSYSVFTSPRRVRFYEMEYAVPRENGLAAFNRVCRLVHELDLTVGFPVEYRVLGADNIPLSTATGRETAYIAVHVFHGTPYDQYFRGVEEIMTDVGGRPHWGKLHSQDAEALACLYPQWDRFQAVRRQLDPDGRFSNAYLERVLGPIY